MARIGPVVLQVAGDKYVAGSRIASILWDGNGVLLQSGDRVVLRALNGGELLFQATFPESIGANLGSAGINAPHGFSVERIDRGLLMVYLREEI